MRRLKRPPKFSRHKASGQAYVARQHKRPYLGEYGLKQASANYVLFLTDLANLTPTTSDRDSRDGGVDSGVVAGGGQAEVGHRRRLRVCCCRSDYCLGRLDAAAVVFERVAVGEVAVGVAGAGAQGGEPSEVGGGAVGLELGQVFKELS